MAGVAFGDNNIYDTFVFSEPLVKPSMLNVLVAVGVKDNSIIVEEIEDVIPANLPVLLLSKELKSKALYTAESKEAGSVKDCLLKVAGEKGQEVKLGEVYLLYNDVFYLSQKGTIPAGGIYLPKPVSKTRSALVIGGENDGTTGIIDAVRLIDNSLSGSWYDLSGRKFNGKPTTKGIYIINGKKVVIK